MKIRFLLLCLTLSACSNLPPAIEDAPLYDLSYGEAKQKLAQFKNAPVRWGGVIVDIDNEQDYTLLQVLYYPLARWGKPQLNKTSEGRFVVKSRDFLDPAIYAKNATLTVAGKLTGEMDRQIGNKTLHVPVIAAETLHVWPSYDTNNYYQGGFGAGFGPMGFYGYPYYWNGFYRPYPFYPFGY